jgi:DNA-3-methyladenine glycosylase II
MTRLDTKSDLKRAAECLIVVEPRFAPVIARNGLPPLRHSEAGLRSLLRIVTEQLISRQAAEAIWNRLASRLDPFDAEQVLACEEAELRALGLSGAKARSFHAAAQAAHNGMWDRDLSEQELVQTLLDIPGIGPWTANIYLLTAARAADAWPAADIALQRAAMDLLSLPTKPDARHMVHLAEGWRPFRSTAALLLWSHYQDLKRLPKA